MEMSAKYLFFLFVMLAAAACGSDTPTKTVPAVQSPTPERAPSTEVSESSPTGARTLAAGELSLPAARAFGEPGYHEVLTASHDVPSDIGPTEGMRLVLRLRDAGRPEQTCSREHPLSGCATADWSDATSRPKVPTGGVFDNSLSLQFASGTKAVFLSESGELRDAPDRFDPG